MSTTDLLTHTNVRVDRSRVSIACWLIAFLLAGFFAARNLATWSARIFYPGEESYEGCALVETARLRQGVPIYAPPSNEGFAGATYGPLYYLVGARLVDPKRPSYLPVRLLSALGILGCAAGCGLLAFWLSRSRLASYMGPLIFLSYGIVTYHGVSALSDNVALFLFFSGFLIAYRFRNSSAILLAPSLMALGFYYKPQYVAGPLAVFAFLLIEKRYLRAAQFAGMLALCALALFGFFQWIAFPGQEFWRHFLLYQATLFSWHQWEVGLLVFALMFAVPLLLSFEFLRREPDKMMGAYLACAVLLGVLTIGKESAFIQYFYESILAVSVLVPALLAKRLAERPGRIEIILLLGFSLVAGQWYTPPAPQPPAWEEHHAVQSFLRRNFSPNARALGFRGGDLLQAGLDSPFSDLFQTELLARRRIVPDDHLVAQIRAHWFSVIVLDFDLRSERDSVWLNYYLTDPTRKAIEQNYEIAATLPVPSPEKLSDRDRFYVYVPRSTHHNDAAAAGNGQPGW